MTLTEIQEKVLTDEAFVESEFRRIQYLYGLQRVVRNHLTRTEDIETESVAEHVYAMGVLAHYFSVIEGLDTILDMDKVYKLITWHDIDEIETGDIIGYLKTDADREREKIATVTMLEKAPLLLRSEIEALLIEYKAQQTSEAKFVKAIDKMDPIFYLLNENGKKLFDLHKATEDQHSRIKKPYIEAYPYMFRFFTVTTQMFRDGGYFHPENEQ